MNQSTAAPDSASNGDCPKWKRQLERVGMSHLTVPHDSAQGLDARSGESATALTASKACFL
jgi:hypothetical protein